MAFANLSRSQSYEAFLLSLSDSTLGVLSGLLDAIAAAAPPAAPAAANCLLLLDCFTILATSPFLLGSNDNLGAAVFTGFANVAGILLDDVLVELDLGDTDELDPGFLASIFNSICFSVWILLATDFLTASLEFLKCVLTFAAFLSWIALIISASLILLLAPIRDATQFPALSGPYWTDVLYSISCTARPRLLKSTPVFLKTTLCATP